MAVSILEKNSEFFNIAIRGGRGLRKKSQRFISPPPLYSARKSSGYYCGAGISKKRSELSQLDYTVKIIKLFFLKWNQLFINNFGSLNPNPAHDIYHRAKIFQSCQFHSCKIFAFCEKKNCRRFRISKCLSVIQN